MSVISGIVEFKSEKMYHPYVSDSQVHDQVFSKHTLKEMISSSDIPAGTQLVIESDNCSGQFKSAHHFYHLQQLSNELGSTIVRMYGIAGHGKGEVDHVGGVAKVAVRRQIAGGEVFLRSKNIVEFLRNKFGENTSPSYHIVEIEEKPSEEERDLDHRKVFSTVDGSSSFHVIIFTPHSTTFRASPRLCLCEKCDKEYGSCELFVEHELKVLEIKPAALRSNVPPPPEVIGQEEVNDFIQPGTYVAVTAPQNGNSLEMVWFIEVTEVNRTLTESSIDGYQNHMAAGITHNVGHFLERDPRSNLKVTYFNRSQKETFFFKESILYPCVNTTASKKFLTLSMGDYMDVLNYIEENGYCHL